MRSVAKEASRNSGGARTVAPLLVVLALGFCAPGLADDVHLENGRVFEDVIATLTDTHVIIEMEYGRMRLPRAQVQRVEERPSPLQTFRSRRAALLADPSSPASAWAELALWSWVHGLRRDASETALLAVRLDPEVDGLDSMLKQQGYERDPELGWVPYAVAMERRGLVVYGGEWMTPERRAALSAEERAARAAAHAEAATREDAGRDDRDDPGPTANEVALASIDLAREIAAGRMGVTVARTSGLSPYHPVFVPALPLSGSGGFWTGRRDGHRHGPPHRPGPISRHREQVAADWEALATRIPGSRLPLSAFQPPPK
ncbi:MAG TPA: hypothetical protein VMT85_14390 [Thermoanaerobaculia bacterium]|nr:hypothetical protein [Thermoanaerobaculia bacterium]